LLSVGMWKRRVGVTARLRQIGGNQVIGSPQIASEMAAPIELRTPMGTAASRCIRVRMEAWRQWRWSQSTEHNPTSGGTEPERPVVGGAARLAARMRRCLKLRQGARPLRPPAPFPFSFIFRKRKNLSRVRKPRPNCGRALDKFSLFQRVLRDKGKGASVRGSPVLPPVGRPRELLCGPRQKPLDRGRPSHGSRDRKGAKALPVFQPAPKIRTSLRRPGSAPVTCP